MIQQPVLFVRGLPLLSVWRHCSDLQERPSQIPYRLDSSLRGAGGRGIGYLHTHCLCPDIIVTLFRHESHGGVDDEIHPPVSYVVDDIRMTLMHFQDDLTDDPCIIEVSGSPPGRCYRESELLQGLCDGDDGLSIPLVDRDEHFSALWKLVSRADL